MWSQRLAVCAGLRFGRSGASVKSAGGAEPELRSEPFREAPFPPMAAVGPDEGTGRPDLEDDPYFRIADRACIDRGDDA